MPYQHIPAMLGEVIHYLSPMPGNIFVDCTLGGAGHAKAILRKIIPDGLLIGIDQDLDAIRNAEKVLKPYASNIRLVHDNFANLPAILARLDIGQVDGILLDLGISLHHLDASGRGFSFRKDEPLDMRMNTTTSTRADDIVNQWSEKRLAKIFKDYGEERWARAIAKRIVRERELAPIRTSKRLSEIICDAIPRKAIARQRIHPATRAFMAVRIAVNKELERLDRFMDHAVDFLNPKGRLCVLSFHSLEDRIVKHRIKALEKGCTCPPDFPKCVCGRKRIVNTLTRKPLQPTKEEIARNPMSRSTKLRAVEKI